MGLWPFGKRSKGLGEPLDYYRQGLDLVGDGRYHEALTAFRLALRQTPEDATIMEQMAVCYTRIGMPEEAFKYYEGAITTGSQTPAAHYGLAFLHLRRGDEENARRHLEAFLDRAPSGDEAAAHVEHARQTLDRLRAGRSERGAGEALSGDEN